MKNRSWKTYQEKILRQERRWPEYVHGKSLLLGFAIFFSVFVLYRATTSFGFLPEKSQTGAASYSDLVLPALDPTQRSPDAALGILAEIREIDEAGGEAGAYDAGPIYYQGKPLAIDVGLQTLIHNAFERYDPIAGAAVVLDAETSEVLALVHYREKKSALSHAQEFLPLKAVFPAASIFKIVTAAAGIEHAGAVTSTPLRTVGNPYDLDPSKLQERRLRRGRTIGLSKALARSDNVAFADLTQRFLDRKRLFDTAYEFGFEQDIPFALPVERSRLTEITNAYDLAKASTGLGGISLSPLHGALIAAAVANDGKANYPMIFDSDAGTHPIGNFVEISPATAFALATMMKGTVKDGTARKTFEDSSRHPILRNAIIGGKTGTLWSDELHGTCDWFVGFAKNTSRKIAVSVVFVNGPVWHIKSSFLARKVFIKTLEDLPTLTAKSSVN